MSRFLMKFTLSVFVVIGIATASYAQDEANMARPLTKSGSAAFMFNLGGLGAFGLGAEAIGTVNVVVPTGPTTTFTFNQPVVGAGCNRADAEGEQCPGEMTPTCWSWAAGR